MFGSLSERFQNLFSTFGRNNLITENNISEAVREARLALLEADVSYSVASTFVKEVKEKALGEKVLKSLKPKQQFIKIVHDQLIELMGSHEATLNLASKPAVIMMCGLQGSGKTTTSAKLANLLTLQKKKVLLAACDLQRPAAVDQLKILAGSINVDLFSIEGEKKPIKVAKNALEKASNEKYDVLIVDTAGRLHLDDELMSELEQLKREINPTDILFVASAATGQDAVNTAREFDKKVSITGAILTMLDGNARAGAAISISHITKKPLLFEGTGEKITDIQVFNPRSMADRILGMGDVINLAKKAEATISEEESLKLEKKIKKASFTYDDYLTQMGMVKKMGSLKGLMKMVPGLSSFGDLDFSENELKKTEAIILSMTPDERNEQEELSYSRKKRIARGSGTKMDDVNRLVKGFKRLKQLMKNMPNIGKKGFKGVIPDINDIKQQLEENNLWH
jgi:signal recognition particle subunit SRP54